MPASLSDLRARLDTLRALTPLSGITHDSRAVRPGWLYVALAGRATHGARHIPQALARGAAAVAVSAREPRPPELPPEVPTLLLSDPRRDLAHLSEWVWGEPLRALRLAGVTGTNGKTTTTTLLADALAEEEGDVGLLGTVLGRGGGLAEASAMTTLEAPALHERFARFRDAGVRTCVMEVSSIGVSEERVRAARFAAAAFTNLTEDHLDYHGTMESYAAAKLTFLRELLAPGATAVVNLDDPWGAEAAAAARAGGARVWGLSLHAPAADDAARGGDGLDGRVGWRALSLHADGLEGVLATPLGDVALRAPLIGEFNAYNVATAAALALALGVGEGALQRAMARARVRGRMERALGGLDAPWALDPVILVDYAHTPDALRRALAALRAPLAGEAGGAGGAGEAGGGRRLWCLFGCGGDRDAHKRPLMGRAAALADGVILTSDNPRGEDPARIAAAVLEGCRAAGLAEALAGAPQQGAVWVELDRARALHAAVAALAPGDVLLVAGKGHEAYQEARGARAPFDDLEHANGALRAWRAAWSLHTRALCHDAGGALVAGAHGPLAGGVIDSRALAPREAFFCLRGARDGHDFAAAAAAAGAAAVVTRRGWRPAPEARAALLEALARGGGAWVEVDEPERALAAFAAAHRRRAFRGVLVGLTGSNGKTSTKELLAAALGRVAPTLATEGNLNNHLGVPLTLLRLRPHHRLAVIEMGMSAPGEIAHLAALARPDVGLITTVAAAHLEGLGTIEAVARAKGELFAGLAADGHAHFNEALPHRAEALAAARCHLHPVSEREARLGVAAHSPHESAASLSLSARALWEATGVGAAEPAGAEGGAGEGEAGGPWGGEGGFEGTLRLRLVGDHQLHNARLALSAALSALALLSARDGAPPRAARAAAVAALPALLAGLAASPPPSLRGEARPLPGGGVAWVDCYNANPQSTLAAARTFWASGLRGPLVLGELKELGPTADALHAALGRDIEALVGPAALVLTAGDGARALHEALLAAGHHPARAAHYPLSALDALTAHLRAALAEAPQQSVLIKGSRSGRLERVADALAPPLPSSPAHP
ncbi:MAG: UDP-N-acetylmuramyl-tripeptide synthetase [Deltaproteobacteria bacterium]|nr:UDP-N-acetylmuramyl-tripeptide synthetase [Deltaproteobacteria bacterium]